MKRSISDPEPVHRAYLPPLLFAAAALALTWPLALHLGNQLPLGTESSASVVYFNLWSLRWNEIQITSIFNSYWDAPIFFPNLGSFALSEAMPLSGWFYWLLRNLGANYAAGYNLLLMTALTLNGLSGYSLAKRLRLDFGPSLLAGALVIGLPFVGREMGVLQLVMVWPVLFGWRSWLAFAEKPGWRSALMPGWWFAVMVWTSTQYALLASLFVLPAAAVFLRREHFSRQGLGFLLFGGLAAALLSAPLIAPQMDVLRNYARSTGTVENLSAQPVDYLRLEKYSLGAQWTPWLQNGEGSGQKLYPGTGHLALALLGMVQAIRSGNQRWALFCLAGAMMAGLLSLGFDFSIAKWQPYQTLRDYFPGFAQFRSPFRLAVFVQLFSAVMAGFGLQRIWAERGRWGQAFAIALVALSLAEVYPGTARLHAFPQPAFTEPWIEWLHAQAPGAVVHLPYVDSTRSSAFEQTTLWMLQGLEHGHPLANGYSGFFPESHSQLRQALPGFPDSTSLTVVRELGIRYALVDAEWWQALDAAQRQIHRSDLLLLYEDSDMIVFAVLASGG